MSTRFKPPTVTLCSHYVLSIYSFYRCHHVGESQDQRPTEIHQDKWTKSGWILECRWAICHSHLKNARKYKQCNEKTQLQLTTPASNYYYSWTNWRFALKCIIAIILTDIAIVIWFAILEGMIIFTTFLFSLKNILKRLCCVISFCVARICTK